MSFMPVCLNFERIRIVVVGRGRIAEQKLETLLEYTQNILVCAPDISLNVCKRAITFLQRPYEEKVLEGAGLVTICNKQRS